MREHLESKHKDVEADAHIITARDMPAIDKYIKHRVMEVKYAKWVAIGISISAIVVNVILGVLDFMFVR